MSGRETRTQRFANPYFDIDLTYDLLRADAAHLELQAIAGFFEQASGETAPFWVEPPGLSAVTGQAIRTRRRLDDGFPAGRLDRFLHRPRLRDIGRRCGLPKRCRAAERMDRFKRISTGDHIHVGAGAGAAITADFGILWLCRFAEDVQDFEEFMTMLWTLRTVRLMTVRP